MLDVVVQGAGSLVAAAPTGADWTRAGAVVVAAVVLGVATNRVLRALITRWVGSRFAAIVTGRLVAYVIVTVGFVYALNHLGVQVGPLLGALGLGGLVLALALQGVVENFVSSLIIQARRPYTLGDTVRLGVHVGRVTDVDSRTTVLDGLDGTTIRIPNKVVISDAIVNLTSGPARRSSLEVGVAYGTDLDRATQTLRAALDRVPRVLVTPLPAVQLTRFAASSIDFTIWYWHGSDIASEQAARHDLMLAVHHAAADAQIELAFPQVVVWSGESSGSPYERAPSEVFSPGPPLPEATPTRPRPITWRLGRRPSG